MVIYHSQKFSSFPFSQKADFLLKLSNSASFLAISSTNGTLLQEVIAGNRPSVIWFSLQAWKWSQHQRLAASHCEACLMFTLVTCRTVLTIGSPLKDPKPQPKAPTQRQNIRGQWGMCLLLIAFDKLKTISSSNSKIPCLKMEKTEPNPKSPCAIFEVSCVLDWKTKAKFNFRFCSCFYLAAKFSVLSSENQSFG